MAMARMEDWGIPLVETPERVDASLTERCLPTSLLHQVQSLDARLDALETEFEDLFQARMCKSRASGSSACCRRVRLSVVST
jgi:hypothetical protein